MLSNQKRGDVFIISGPSGSGKSTIRVELLKLFPDIKFSISYTTRQPRNDKGDTLDYHFISRKQFEDMIAKDELVEWAEVHGDLYGTPTQSLKSSIETDSQILLEIDVQGGYAIKKKFPESVLIFILPPNYQELEKRLRERAMNSEEEIERRLQVAKREIIAGKDYDCLVVNDTLMNCVEQIKAIIVAQGCRNKAQMPLVDKIISDFKA